MNVRMRRRAVACPALFRWGFVFAIAFVAGWPVIDAPSMAQSAPPTLGPSGLPLPRFVSLASDAANMRAGPGNRYPIEWVYHQSGLPTLVIAEYDMWRKIRDHDGTEGWMYTSLLSGKRTVVVTAERAVLHSRKDKNSRQLLIAEKNVLGKLLNCVPDWCRVKIDGSKGWLKRDTVWGIGADEVLR